MSHNNLITFNAADVKRLVVLAEKCESRRPAITQLGSSHVKQDWSRIEPALWLFKDHGIGLLSNGLPSAPADYPVVFAEHCNPEKAEEGGDQYHRVHVRANELFGPGNYVVVIPTRLVRQALLFSGSSLHIRLFHRNLTFTERVSAIASRLMGRSLNVAIPSPYMELVPA